MYQNIELVNANGQPTAKIAVGSTAAISDGIAAANIASVLANHAFKSSTLTAAVNGQATCAAGGSGSGTGTCQISNEQVTITINLPGVLGNAYQFKTLITDSIDRQLGNRMNTLSADNYTSTSSGIVLTDPDTISPTTVSPLRATNNVAQNVHNLFRIGQESFTGFAPYTVTDHQASSEFTYTENQNFWIGSGTPSNGVYYDQNSNFRQVVARPNQLAYDAFFGGNDWGIPVCTNNLNISGNWTSCTSDSDRTDNHRVQISFLGDNWVISKMTQPSDVTNPLPSSSNAINGGQIKLAKEAKYDIINVGGVIDGGTFKVRLADISTATGANNEHPAILDILDANDAVTGQIQVNPGDTYTFTQSSTGQSIKVHVYRTAPGFTLNAKWAEIAIYTDEITLQDGQRYNLASSSDANWGHVYASLIWKNRDGSSTDVTADSLRQIVLYTDDMTSYAPQFDNTRMTSGQSIAFPNTGNGYSVTYNGLDLTDADRVSVQLQDSTGSSISLGNDVSGTWDCNTKNGSYSGNFIKVWSAQADAFGGTSFGTDALQGDTTNQFYLDPTGSHNWGNNDTQVYTGVNDTQVFWKPSGCQFYKAANMTIVTGSEPAGNVKGRNTTLTSSFTATGSTTGAAVQFVTAGSDSSVPGAIIWQFANVSNASALNTSSGGYGATTFTTAPVGEIVLQEDAGKYNSTDHYPVFSRFPVFFANGNEFQFKTSDSSTAVAYYNGVNTSDVTTGASLHPLASAAALELPVTTERGSTITGVSLTNANLNVANKVAQPTFTFSATGTNVSSSGSDWTAKVGDSKTLPDGATLTVKDISQTVGACVAGTSGAAPACTVDMTPVAARIMPDNVASVEVSQPYDIKGTSLVLSDTDAANVGGVVITVGGPVVNSLTASVLADANVDFATTSVVVKAYGSKIVVAGNTAADTMTAANEFIAALQTS